MELDQVEASERRGVLVLPPARQPEVDALDAVRQLGGVVARERTAEPFGEHADQRHDQGRGRAQA
jgi:hypothetical protein